MAKPLPLSCALPLMNPKFSRQCSIVRLGGLLFLVLGRRPSPGVREQEGRPDGRQHAAITSPERRCRSGRKALRSSAATSSATSFSRSISTSTARPSAASENGKIQQVASFLQQSNSQIIIAGFTDERGTAEYNRGLGERRAQSVREALIAMGANAQNIQTVSFGAEMPADPASNEAAWAKNRRAEIGVVK